MKKYQVHLPATGQFIYSPIFGYDILVVLKVGCTILSLKRKVCNLHKSFCTFWKAHNSSFQKTLFYFCTINSFWFICKKVLIIVNFIPIINIFLPINQKIFILQKKNSVFWKARVMSFSKIQKLLCKLKTFRFRDKIVHPTFRTTRMSYPNIGL